MESVVILTMIKLFLLISVINFSRISAVDRAHDENNVRNGAITADGSKGINDSENNNREVKNGIGFEPYIQEFEWAGNQKKYDFSDYGNKSDRYIASFKIDGFLWPETAGSRWAGKNGSILIGVKKPYYRIDKNPRIKGKVDLKMEGSIFGMQNRSIITISYDLRSEETYGRISTSISFYSFSYNITIPFGKNRLK